MSEDELLYEDPTGTETSAPNAIVELDAHLESYPNSPREAPVIRPDALSAVADYCLEVGFAETSAKVEILRRHFLEDEEFVPRYTVGELTDFTIELAKTRVNAFYASPDEYTYDEIMRIVSELSSIGQLIDESADAPLDDRIRDLDHDGYEVGDTQGEYFDPVSVLCGRQTVYLIDEDGDRLTAPDHY